MKPKEKFEDKVIFIRQKNYNGTRESVKALSLNQMKYAVIDVYEKYEWEAMLDIMGIDRNRRGG